MAQKGGPENEQRDRNFWKWMALVGLGVIAAVGGMEIKNTVLYLGGLAIALGGLVGGGTNYFINS